MNIEALIPNVAGWFGIDPATALLILVLIHTLANLAGRLIPDDATGWLGQIRKAAKIVGTYVPNKTGIPTSDDRAPGASSVVPPFPGLVQQPLDGGVVEDIVSRVATRLSERKDS